MDTAHSGHTCFISALHTLPIKYNCSFESITKGKDNFQRRRVLELSLEIAIIYPWSGKHGISEKFSCYVKQNKTKN